MPDFPRGHWHCAFADRTGAAVRVWDCVGVKPRKLHILWRERTSLGHTEVYGSNDDVELWAEWIPADYTVTYSPGKAGVGQQQTSKKTHDVDLMLRDVVFSRLGYTQTGWATADGGEKAYDLEAAYTNNAAVTLYPHWTANTYRVLLEFRGGSGGTKEVAAAYGEEMPRITVPMRSGHTFAGYFADVDRPETQYYSIQSPAMARGRGICLAQQPCTLNG